MAPVVVLSTLLSACATTNPGDGARVQYRLPQTEVHVVLSVDVETCDPLKMKATMAVDAVAVPSDSIYYISGSQLNSRVTKRGLVIEVDDNGVISSINSSSTDQKAVILGDVVKVAAAAATLGVAMSDTHVDEKLACGNDTATLVKNEKDVEYSIDALRKDMYKTRPVNPANQTEIDALAKQVAALKALLHKEAVATVEYKDVKPGIVSLKFKMDDVETLFKTERTAGGHVIAVSQGIAGSTKDLFAAALHFTKFDPTPAIHPEKPADSQTCGLIMKVPSQDQLQATIVTKRPTLIKPETERKTVIPFSREGGQDLCLSAAFGENRTVKMTYTKFGQVKSFDWSSDATDANVANALAGAAPDAASFVKSVHDRDLIADKAELDRLTTEKALKAARACKVAMDAGATSCP